MMRTLSFIVGLLAAVAAFTAPGASAEAVFTAGEVGATIQGTAETNPTWTVTGSNAPCAESSFAGVTEAAESETLRVVPTYKDCTAFGLPGTVTNENCVFVIFSSGALTIEPVAPKSSCQFVIAGSSIFGKCKVIIKNQTIANAVTFGSSSFEVKATFGATGLAAEVTESTGVCPLSKGSHKTVTYTGKLSLSAKGAWLRWHAGTNRFLAGMVGARIIESTIQRHWFKVGGNEFECRTTWFTGLTEGIETTVLRFVPTYQECNNGFFANTLINKNCQYEIHATGGMDIERVSWGEPCQMVLTTTQAGSKCKVVFGEQGLEGVSYMNGASDLKLTIDLTEIEAEVTESTGGCWLSLGKTTIQYTAESTLQAEGTTLQWAA